MALGVPYYSVVWGTMATTFVTGLCVATAMTLLVMPLLWDLVARRRERRERRDAQREEKRSRREAESAESGI
jgi:HAE1 family hydrophobic/amphiphilic exporter-1